MMLFDFACEDGHEFEEFVQSDVKTLPCTKCGNMASRQISLLRIDYLRMGVDPSGCPTAGDKWAKMQTDKGRGVKSSRFSGR